LKKYALTKLSNGFTVIFSATFKGIDSVCLDIKQLISGPDLGDLYFDIILGVREVLTNAVLHGSKMDSNRDVSLSIEADVNRILIRVTDSGSGFDWREAEKKIALPTETHGRGFSILKHYFDSYRFNEIGNEVELIKKTK
jgi:anti-sigma regulatory factor (Ser/Thr protein kinase)